MTTAAPATVIGIASPVVAVGRPLDAVAVARDGAAAYAVARWCDGGLAHLRRPAPAATT